MFYLNNLSQEVKEKEIMLLTNGRRENVPRNTVSTITPKSKEVEKKGHPSSVYVVSFSQKKNSRAVRD